MTCSGNKFIHFKDIHSFFDAGGFRHHAIFNLVQLVHKAAASNNREIAKKKV